MSEPLTPAEHTARLAEALGLVMWHTMSNGTERLTAALESLDALSAALADRDARILELEEEAYREHKRVEFWSLLAEQADARIQELERALQAARAVVRAFIAESEDWNDGSYALWREDDLINALVALRAALAGVPPQEASEPGMKRPSGPSEAVSHEPGSLTSPVAQEPIRAALQLLSEHPDIEASAAHEAWLNGTAALDALIDDRDRLGNELARERAKPGGSWDQADDEQSAAVERTQE